MKSTVVSTLIACNFIKDFIIRRKEIFAFKQCFLPNETILVQVYPKDWARHSFLSNLASFPFDRNATRARESAILLNYR